MMQAVQVWQAANPALTVVTMDESTLCPYPCLAYAIDPDLLMRMDGELRISNFMLWPVDCTEFFLPRRWLGFTPQVLDEGGSGRALATTALVLSAH